VKHICAFVRKNLSLFPHGRNKNLALDKAA